MAKLMRQTLWVLIILGMTYSIAYPQVDWMPDPNLRQAVREHIRLPVGAPLEVRHLHHLEYLDSSNRGTTNLTGLEHATNLRDLRIAQNPIEDLSPIANLTQLEELHFWQDPLRPTNLNLRPLTHLTNLRMLVLSGNGITDISPLANLQHLTRLYLDKNNIDDISPLADLVNLRELHIFQNPITDLSPLANLTELEDLGFWHGPPRPTNLDLSPLTHLTKLRVLSLSGNGITDISPLANLQHLTYLHLDRNNIDDFSPLVGLTNLRELWIRKNLALDFSMLSHLNLTTFEYDEFLCEISPLDPPVIQRINNRTFPSVALAGSSLVKRNPIRWFPWDPLDVFHDEVSKHDLNYFGFKYGLHWHLTPEEPTEGLSTRLVGDLESVKWTHQQIMNRNPNFITLPGVSFHYTTSSDHFPPDSDFWVGAKNNALWGEWMIDFLNPKVQQLIIDRVVAIAECGILDGILFDSFWHNGTRFPGREHFPQTDAEIIAATTRILKGIRERVRDDFLIIANANRTKLTLYAEYINGSFMETGRNPTLYPEDRRIEVLIESEDSLLWNEENLREPRINVLEGSGVFEPLDSPNNLRWMRLFTTMSLTHSDGYCNFRVPHEIGGYIQGVHIWYDFWDADLGKPVGEKGVLYKNPQGVSIDGLFIREFTNGWAVYNRSGKAQKIQLPEQATGVESGTTATEHTVPDLDGEIYLKRITDRHDVNGDGRINVLDLVIVANAIGKTEPDVNGDGTVNVLDLVQVANQIGE